MRNTFKWVLQVIMSIVFSSAHAGAYDDFFKAIDMDDGRTISGLIRRGFDANSPSMSGQTPLFLAIRTGAHQAVAALLTAPDLKVDQVNEANETALMMAALRGHLEWCKRLVERGAAVNREGWTPLHYAAAGPNPLVTAYLIEMRAAVDASSPNATTPLMMAARYGHEDSVRVLLAANANPRLRNQKDLSAADFAREAGREALAQQLAQWAR